MTTLNLDDFLSSSGPLFDVRTPAEFTQGHIPGARNLPLFDDDERVVVGTTYKRQGREAAILAGLDYVGPKMRRLIEQAMVVAGPPLSAPLRMHCWRGGMRSGAVSWLMRFYGYDVVTLAGGYKSFRRHALDVVGTPRTILIVGGRTGSGKTQVLHALAAAGEQVLDLEGLAHHKGSAFGAIGEAPQPSTEHFENLVGAQWHTFDPERVVWIEDESRMVGQCRIPERLWPQMVEAHAVVVDSAMERRVARLVHAYGQAGRHQLERCFQAIRKRLGGLRLKQAMGALQQEELGRAAELALHYYDRAYDHGIARRVGAGLVAHHVDGDREAADVAADLIAFSKTFDPIHRTT
ncbi:MAG: tRNA 2-selenouridine(34) synthase MnmH [Myxococcota bacterium]